MYQEAKPWKGEKSYLKIENLLKGWSSKRSYSLILTECMSEQLDSTNGFCSPLCAKHCAQLWGPQDIFWPSRSSQSRREKQINQFLQYKVIRSYERFKRRASEKVIFLTTGKGVSDRKGRHAA